jgi:hypothetical protein
MGLFKKKKRKEEHSFVEESSAKGTRAQPSGTFEARQDVPRLKEAARQGNDRLSTGKHSLEAGHGSDLGYRDPKSSRLKVRLRKSLSQLFMDKIQLQTPQPALPPLSAEVCLIEKSLIVVITRRPFLLTNIIVIRIRDVHEKPGANSSGT